jgi:hypothetical protein
MEKFIVYVMFITIYDFCRKVNAAIRRLGFMAMRGPVGINRLRRAPVMSTNEMGIIPLMSLMTRNSCMIR